MKNTRRCPKCGGSDIICGTTAVNGAYDKLQAGVFKAARTDSGPSYEAWPTAWRPFCKSVRTALGKTS